MDDLWCGWEPEYLEYPSLPMSVLRKNGKSGRRLTFPWCVLSDCFPLITMCGTLISDREFAFHFGVVTIGYPIQSVCMKAGNLY